MIAACSYFAAASNHLPVDETDARQRRIEARIEVAVVATSVEIRISVRIGLLFPSVGLVGRSQWVFV